VAEVEPDALDDLLGDLLGAVQRGEPSP